MSENHKGIQITVKQWAPGTTFSYPGTSAGISMTSLAPPQQCSYIYPVMPIPQVPSVLKVNTFQFVTVSDGVKASYTNADGLAEYISSDIMDPSAVSYMNLFINGMLQPLNVYSVSTGLLTIDSVPAKGAPISLQFILIQSV